METELWKSHSSVFVRKYDPFGSTQGGRGASGFDYRFSFNGQEKTPEIADGHTTAKYWEHDSRIARRWNVDPRLNYSISPYGTFAGNPVIHTDVNGDTSIFFLAMKGDYNTPPSVMVFNDDLPNAVIHINNIEDYNEACTLAECGMIGDARTLGVSYMVNGMFQLASSTYKKDNIYSKVIIGGIDGRTSFNWHNEKGADLIIDGSIVSVDIGKDFIQGEGNAIGQSTEVPRIHVHTDGPIPHSYIEREGRTGSVTLFGISPSLADRKAWKSFLGGSEGSNKAKNYSGYYDIALAPNHIWFYQEGSGENSYTTIGIPISSFGGRDYMNPVIRKYWSSYSKEIKGQIYLFDYKRYINTVGTEDIRSLQTDEYMIKYGKKR